MLIRWATEKEKEIYGYTEFGKYDVLVAVDRMTETVLGIIGFSRERREIGEARIFDSWRGLHTPPLCGGYKICNPSPIPYENNIPRCSAARYVDSAKENSIREKLAMCAERQCNPKGHSFHYRYPEYEKETNKEFCPCCNSAPQPDGLMDIAELEYSWVTAERIAQGRLFGKCHVLCKKHYVHLFDMTKDDLAGFMGDIQKAAKALQEVTGAIKINYEIHGNTAPHLHCHLFPRYLDDDFPGQGIDVKLIEPSPYESDDEFDWFFREMQKKFKVSP